MWFEAVSGLRINLEKSELIPVGKVENIDDLAFLWVLRLSQYQCGMEWKSDFVKDWPCGRDNTYPREGEQF